MTVVIDSVVTEDSSPAVAPFRVSYQSGFTTATAKFTVSGTGPVRAYRMMNGGASVISGAELSRLGMVCGIARCGDKAQAIPTPHQFTEVIAASALGLSDADYPIQLYVYNGAVFE